MSDNVIALRSARLSLSRITYNCDLTHINGFVIPLGVIAEMTLGKFRVMGLIARTILTSSESSRVGSLFRTKLNNPFELLRQEFDWAFKSTSPNEALESLATKHQNSFLFSVPVITIIRNAQTSTVGAAAAEYVRSELRTQRDQEFFKLLDDCWGTPDDVPPSEEISKLVA